MKSENPVQRVLAARKRGREQDRDVRERWHQTSRELSRAVTDRQSEAARAERAYKDAVEASRKAERAAQDAASVSAVADEAVSDAEARLQAHLEAQLLDSTCYECHGKGRVDGGLCLNPACEAAWEQTRQAALGSFATSDKGPMQLLGRLVLYRDSERRRLMETDAGLPLPDPREEMWDWWGRVGVAWTLLGG